MSTLRTNGYVFIYLKTINNIAPKYYNLETNCRIYKNISAQANEQFNVVFTLLLSYKSVV